MATVSMTVNGKSVTADVDPRTLLVQFLRDNLRLTGTHVGCDTSQCGACVVHLNGQAVKSCTILARPGGCQRGDDHRGLAQGRRAAPDAGGFPRASRAAMRLLHAGHDHGRRRHREPQGHRASTSRRSGPSSKAICAAARATTTSSRRSPPAPGNGPGRRCRRRPPSRSARRARRNHGVLERRRETADEPRSKRHTLRSLLRGLPLRSGTSNEATQESGRNP